MFWLLLVWRGHLSAYNLKLGVLGLFRCLYTDGNEVLLASQNLRAEVFEHLLWCQALWCLQVLGLLLV